MSIGRPKFPRPRADEMGEERSSGWRPFFENARDSREWNSMAQFAMVTRLWLFKSCGWKTGSGEGAFSEEK